MTPTEIADRLEGVRARIRAACLAAGRAPDAVTLVAVSKLQPEDAIRAAYAAGQRAFGENYVQELSAKHSALADLPDLAWHMIGHLQTNKARFVAPVASCVHSIDSVRLVEALDRHATARRAALDALVQVHLGGGEHRGGCAPEALGDVLAALSRATSLRARGLMTVPPPSDDPAEARGVFDTLRALRDAHGGAEALPELSMGMTHDLEVAIACGATLVRVGTAIFGARS